MALVLLGTRVFLCTGAQEEFTAYVPRTLQIGEENLPCQILGGMNDDSI